MLRPYKSCKPPHAGLDEVGRGCLAGPVVAGAVILPIHFDLPGLTDSKRTSPEDRTRLARLIKDQALAWSIGISWPQEIDATDILQSTLLAMIRAVRTLKVEPRSLLVDGNQKVPLPLPQQCIPGGDGSVPAISAASIVAKTFRDNLLDHLDKRYPGYGFSVHKGYGTKMHLQALQTLGPCAQHRTSFRKVVQTAARGKLLWLPGI